MTEIIGVRFKAGGKLYYFNPRGQQVAVGQHVIIETSKGVEFGECVQANTMVDEMELVSTLRPMLRIATKEDFRTVERNAQLEKDAYAVCQQKIAEHKLDMKLVEVKYSFDGSKLLFFFTSDERVDFRALVKDLASVFHTRIELRQIGVRDEAKMMGGLGICGRPYCCHQFLSDFQPVSIKMAKTQNISLNPTKISGACGRLMCCLKYEQDTYEELLKTTPKLESLVKTPDGIGTINAIQFLTQQVRVTLDSDPDTPRTYRNSEIEVLRSGKGKRPSAAELEALAKAPTPQPAPKKEAQPAPKMEAQPSALDGQGAPQPRRKPRPPVTPKPVQASREEGQGEGQPKKLPAQGEAPSKKPAPQRRKRVNAPKQGGGQPAANPQAPVGQSPAAGEPGAPQAPRRHRPRHHHPKGGGAPGEGNASDRSQG